MKTILLVFLFIGVLGASAQTTHNLNWQVGANGTEMDITINVNDIVTWTWIDAMPHDVKNVVGSSVETFDSGILTGIGTTYSHTFTVEGINDYFCSVHGAANMNGRITVQSTMGIDDNSFVGFKLLANPTNNYLDIQLPQNVTQGKLTIHDVLGKKIMSTEFKDDQELEVNISSLNKGLYLVTIESDKNKQTRRFLKQ